MCLKASMEIIFMEYLFGTVEEVDFAAIFRRTMVWSFVMESPAHFGCLDICTI